MKVIPMIVGLMRVNCYILFCSNCNEAIVIDPGGESSRILKEIEARNLKLKYIVLTHGHFDHIGAVKELKERTGAKVAIHGEDTELLVDIHKNLSFSMGMECVQTKADLLLEDGDRLYVGDIVCEVVYTPGHSKGSICLIAPGIVFSGDTLFAGSVGRTDFPGGDYSQLMESIVNRLIKLDDQYIVYPGHGEKTNIGIEKATNPFLEGLV